MCSELGTKECSFSSWLVYQQVGILAIWIFICSSPEVRFWRHSQASALIVANLTLYICLTTPWLPAPCHSLTNSPPSLFPPPLNIGYSLELITLQNCSISELLASTSYLLGRSPPPFTLSWHCFCILWSHWGFCSVPLLLNLLVPPGLLVIILPWRSPQQLFFSLIFLALSSANWIHTMKPLIQTSAFRVYALSQHRCHWVHNLTNILGLQADWQSYHLLSFFTGEISNIDPSF